MSYESHFIDCVLCDKRIRRGIFVVKKFGNPPIQYTCVRCYDEL
jgi:hypothetical protein